MKLTTAVTVFSFVLVVLILTLLHSTASAQVAGNSSTTTGADVQSSETVQPLQSANPVQGVPLTPLTPTETTPIVRSTSPVEIPDFHLSQVEIDAKVRKDRIDLVATIEVVVNQGEGWHRVPLRLGQAHFFRREYQGEGEETPDLNSSTTDEGVFWLIKGIGKHQLKLYGWTPLKRSISGGRLELFLPPLLPQFETRIKLEIPDPNVVIHSGKNLTILDVVRGNGSTQIVASAAGTRLDFPWQTPLIGGETVSQVLSRIHLVPSGDHLSLYAEQSIELQQTTLDHLIVRLPSEFELIQITGSQYRSHEEVPNRPGWLRVNFANEIPGPVDLRWIFERELTEDQRQVRLDGFQVEGAVREEGGIRIDEFENSRIIPRPDDFDLVHRIPVSQVRGTTFDLGSRISTGSSRATSSGVPLTAYEYLKQPFHLAFDVVPVEPYFSIDPQYELMFYEHEVELKIHCPLQIDRGSLSELVLKWPEFENQGWRPITSSINDDVTGRVSIETLDQNEIRLSWGQPLQQNAVVTTTFRRAIGDQLLSPLYLSFPQPAASHLGEGLVRVSSEDQLDVKLVSSEETPLLPLSASGVLQANVIGQETNPDSPVFRISDFHQQWTAQLQTHQREVTATTTIEIKESTPTYLSIEQVIHLDVRYGRLTSLNIVPPDLGIPAHYLPESIDVWLGKNRLRTFFTTNALEVLLPNAMKGSFDVRIQYRYPLKNDRDVHDVDLPVITLTDHPYHQARCLVEPVDAVQVRSGQSKWEPVRTSPRGALWINALNDETLVSLPLTIGRQLTEMSQQFVVDRMNIRSYYSNNGMTETWAEFQLDRRPSRVSIRFPVNAEFKEFLVDDMVITDEPLVQKSETFQEVTFKLPEQGTNTPLITVQYRSLHRVVSGLTQQLTMTFPQFAPGIWVEQTIWEVQLPEGHLLFTYPGLVPQFHWVRPFLVWRRLPTADYLRERSQLTRETMPDKFHFQSQNFYAFKEFGPVENVQFRSMNRSLIVLIGAGFTLLLGFVFWNFPATRNVFFLMVLAFLFAVASLWYLEPLLLLLQPAILGVLLALTATLIDSSARRRGEVDSHSRHSHPVFQTPPEEESVSPNVSTRVYRPTAATKSDQMNS